MEEPSTTKSRDNLYKINGREFPTMAKYPAAFINVISEDGTKAEAVHFLQKTWDELCDLRAEHAVLLKKLHNNAIQNVQRELPKAANGNETE